MDVFRNVWGFLSNNYVMPINEALEILERPVPLEDTAVGVTSDLNKNDDEDEQIPDNMCFERSGKVTFVDEHYGIIDNKYYFEHQTITNIKLGETISYLAYTKNNDIKVSKIIERDREWDIPTSESHACYKRSILGQVTARNGRIVIVEPNNIHCNLNKIQTEFIPIVGDWVQLESLVEVNESVQDLSGQVLEIVRILPVRTKLDEGTIKAFDQKSGYGIINLDISFNKDACVPGYVPLIRDKVTYEAIESEQGVCIWRALKVIPSETSSNKFHKVTEDPDQLILVQNKNGIIITENTTVALNSIGEKSVFTLEVTNTDSDPKTVISCKFHSQESQLTLQRPSLDNSVMIRPKQTIVFVFLCQAKFMGTTKELFTFNFEGFKIGRWIKIHVAPDYQRKNFIKNYYQRNERNLTRSARDSFQNSGKDIVVGQRPVKPPSFISNKLPMYDVPERIADVLFKQMEACQYVGHIPIETISPCLKLDITIQNYEDRFHTLLYLEELALQINMRRYDMNRACFIKNGDFLMLEVQDLSERRPSIIIGDKVIAMNPINPKNPKLEGFVHKTGAKHLFIKFNPNFHNMYKGEDYSIEFHSSRTNFRRYHQAIDLAVRNLGKIILFPSSVPNKEPQTYFICEDETTSKDPIVKVEKPVLNKSQEVEIKSSYVRMARKSILKQKERLSSSPDKKNTSSSSSEDSDKKISPSKPQLKLEWFDKKLNHFQKEAVKNILKGEARPLPYFIFGPPGTGKTVTLIETILQILRLLPDSRILVVAPSNSAADLLAIRLLDSGVLIPGDLVRLIAFRCIAEGSIPEKLIPYCVTGDLAREGSREAKTSMQNGVNIGVQASVLGRHRITVGTCMVVGVLYTMGFARGHFTHIVIDEAGQATEPEIMIPLSLLDVTSAQTVLAGDPLQLGPCVFSLLSKEYGLGDSFFERLINRFPYVRDPIGFPDTGGYDPRLVTRLIYNYRSLPEILHLPNMLFYNSELQPVISSHSGEEVELLQKIAEMLPKRKENLPPSVIFHGVRGENFQTTDCPSWFNPVEAGQVFYYVNDLYRLGVSSKDIGIITPYIKQGQQVRSLLHEAEMDLPKIGSVEEFQGQEFKIVILSTVRSNETGAKNDAKYGLGFIASPRRLNVAISRAQALLIIVGNPHLLYTDNYWRSVLLYAFKIGGYRGCDLPRF